MLSTIQAAALQADRRFVPLPDEFGLLRYPVSAGWPVWCRAIGADMRCGRWEAAEARL